MESLHKSLEDMPAPLRALLEPRVQRLGYLGEFFSLAANQPEALVHGLTYNETLKASMSAELVEVVAITVAAAAGNPYERVQHERVALRLGMSPEQIRALRDEREPDAALTAEQRAACRMARHVVRDLGHDGEAAFQHLLDVAGSTVAVGCLLMAGHYLGFSAVANTWRLRAPAPSPLDDGRLDA
jgi:alkylhydroperoxidase family enzyme